MNKQLKDEITRRSSSIQRATVLIVMVALLMPGWRSGPLAQSIFNPIIFDSSEYNETQTNLANLIFDACTTRNAILSSDLQERCNRLVGAALAANIGSPNTKCCGQTEVENAVRSISPEQVVHFGVTATRTSASSLRVIGSAIEARLMSLQASLDSNKSVPAMAIYQGGKVSSLGRGGGAAADDLASPFSTWVNINYQAGDVNSTFVQRGYNFKNGGVTFGADMRAMDDLVVGAAFSYLAGDAYFDLASGRSQSNSYTGSVYGSYYVIENFHLDALAAYGGSNYEIERNIRYVIPGDVVDTKAFGSPDGEQYSMSFGGGYDFSYEGFNLTPFGRIEYVGLQVNQFQESGGDGLALRFGQQTVRSLKTVLGVQTSYAVSVPFGVLLPTFHADYIHEFMDNGQTFTMSLAGDPLGVNANIVTLAPDRNYAIVGAGISATFPHGLSSFISYDALLGYQNVTSHKVVIGLRVEL